MTQPANATASPILRVDDPEQLRAQLADIAERCVREARAQGATAAEAGASTSAGLSVTARMGEVETIEHIRDKGVGVTVYVGQRKGTASSSDFSPAALTETVAAACAIARHTGEDPYSGLADAALMATSFPELDLHHPWDLTAEAAIDLALATESAAREFDAKITKSDGSTVGTHDTAHAYANSHGFTGVRSSTRHSLSCRVIAEDAAGMQRDYWYDTARRHTEMTTPAHIGRRAAERALARLSPQHVPTGQYPVLLPPEIAAGLFGHFIGAIRGANLYRKASFLVDHVDKPVFGEHMHIHEQPHLRRAAGSAAFDSEGVATAPRDIVSAGVLRGYVLDSYAARKLGLPTTANAGGVHNLTIEAGALDHDGLLAQMDTGILIADLMGMGVNLVTGDYSRGASGFWVSGGRIQHPIQEFTIAGNLRDIFMNLLAVGTDVDARGNIRTGSILLDAMTVAGD